MMLLDPNRIKQVLFNLINNAADELAQGGRIGIITRLEAGAPERISLTIEDSGPGVPDALLGGNPGKTVPSRKPHGLGVGLAICRELLELHDGQLQVGSSQRLGGAAFTVHLPVKYPQGADNVNHYTT